jgi:uncharacterized hydrophobic protein (TIGR00341 family)
MNIWCTCLEEGNTLMHILLASEQTEKITDILTGYYADAGPFQLMVLPVEVALPAPEAPSEPAPEEAPEEPKKELRMPWGRISREELYADVTEGIHATPVYLITVIISALVAAIGLMRGDVVIIIGAMVIAPLLGPNVALALAATLGDISLASKSLKTFMVGIITAAAVSLVIGLTSHVDPDIPAISSRTVISVGDIILALSAGTAGALAYTTGVPTALIGVMVAVALLPPLVNFGLLAGTGRAHMALGALLLFLTNITCVNLAGVVTFLAQGIRPKAWWEAEKAKKATRVAITFWVVVLLVLLSIILLWWHN